MGKIIYIKSTVYIIYSAKHLSGTDRLTYDVSAGIFQEQVCNIYPDFLILKTENVNETRDYGLDLGIDIMEGHFTIECK